MPPGFGTLAAAAGLSPYHFHRVFESMLGMAPAEGLCRGPSPQAPARELGKSATITEAILGAATIRAAPLCGRIRRLSA